MGVSHLCLIINSSINFLVYFSMGKRFKAASQRWELQLELTSMLQHAVLNQLEWFGPRILISWSCY